MKTIDLVVPCYNEGKVLNLFYDKVKSIMDKLYTLDYRFIFVDDGSRDNTLEIVKAFCEKDSRVRYVSFSRNFGKEAAMLAGLRMSSAELVGIIDADLQHSPDLIPKMIDAIENEGYDIAAAKRSDRKGEKGFKSFLSSSFYSVANKLTEVEIDDGAQDFRIMKRKVVLSILSISEHNRFTKGIFSFVGFNTKWFSHENCERAAGETKCSIKKLFRYALDGILSFSNVPLKFSFYIGALFFVFGVAFALGSIIYSLKTSGSISMLSMIFSAVTAVGGVVLLCLGTVGEYLARIYDEVKDRPIYIISETNIKKED